jgi:hypothetical protein
VQVLTTIPLHYLAEVPNVGRPDVIGTKASRQSAGVQRLPSHVSPRRLLELVELGQQSFRADVISVAEHLSDVREQLQT